MTNRQWGIFFFVSLILIFSLSTYWIYSSKETERKLRVQKELELSNKLLELTETQGKLSDLTKQKDDLEIQLKSKIADLEATSKDYAATIKNQTEKLDAMNQERDSLKRELQDKERKVLDLSKEVQQRNDVKSDLSDKIKTLEIAKEKGAAGSSEESAESLNGADPTWASDNNTVDLGKIVVQKSSGHAAQVQQVDAQFGFIVINAGTEEGLKYNSAVNILRDKKLIGKAVVQKARQNVSAAIILPQFTKGQVKEGDVISKF